MTVRPKTLTEIFLKNLKYTPNAQPIADSNGLFILAQKKSKVWIYSYINPKTGKRSTKNRIGTYPQMSLAEARHRRDELNTILQTGVDPFEYLTEKQRKEEESKESLQSFAYKWAKWKLDRKKWNECTMRKCLERLEKYLFPRFKNYTLQDFKIDDTILRLQDLEQVGKKGGETLHRIARYLRSILDYAVLTGRIEYNPLLQINSAFGTTETTHQPAIKPEELPEFLLDLKNANISLQTRLLIEWQLLTILRPFEASAVQWDDIDWQELTITIPKERMKGGKRSHTVPLSKQAIAILEEMKKHSGHKLHIFPNRADNTKATTSQSANVAIKRICNGKYKGKLVAHGLRSIASTYLHEKFFTEYLVVESCLAHINKNSVMTAYYRNSYLERRRYIMQEWGDFVERCKYQR